MLPTFLIPFFTRIFECLFFIKAAFYKLCYAGINKYHNIMRNLRKLLSSIRLHQVIFFLMIMCRINFSTVCLVAHFSLPSSSMFGWYLFHECVPQMFCFGNIVSLEYDAIRLKCKKNVNTLPTIKWLKLSKTVSCLFPWMLPAAGYSFWQISYKQSNNTLCCIWL